MSGARPEARGALTALPVLAGLNARGPENVDGVPASMRTLARVFDVRKGEGRAVARAFVLLLLVIAGHTMFETARDSLFLTKLPPRTLNVVYVAIAALAFVAAAISAFVSRKLGAQRGLVVSLLACAIGGSAFWSTVGTSTGVFSFYVYTGLVAGILTPQFWTLAAQTFTPTQGRRLFGPLAAGGVAGGVVGAAASALILSFVSIKWLLPVASSILLTAAVVALMTPAPVETSAPPQKSRQSRESPVTTVKSLTKERLMPRIAALVALSTACVLALDYLFKTTAAQHFSSTASLGRFFGWYYAALNLAGLIFQLFFAGKTVQRFGVIGALGITPLLLFAGGAVTFASGSLFALVLLTRGIDGALRYSLHRVTMELLYLPVPPAQRTASKLFIDTVLMRVAQAAMAVVLYVGVREGVAGPRVVAAIIAVTAFAWLVVGISIRRPYLELFRHALTEGVDAPIPHTGVTVELDLDSAELLVEALGSRDMREVTAALTMLSRARRTKLIPSLILYHDSEDVLTRALGILSDSTRKDWMPLAERLLEDSREGVRIAAVRALTRKGSHAGIARARDDKSPRINAYAAFFDAIADETPKDLRENKRLAFFRDPKAGIARRGLVEAVADSRDPRIVDLMMDMFRVPRPAMTTPEDAAMGFRLSRAMQSIDDPRLIQGAIFALPSRTRRGPVRELLVAKGEPAFVALVAALESDATPRNVKLHIPRTISRFGTQRASDVLVKILASSQPGSIRYKALRGLGRLTEERDVRVDRKKIDIQIKRNLEEHARALALHYVLSSAKNTVNGGLLTEFFAVKAKQARERAFRLLKIAYKYNEVEVAYRALRTDDPIARANAVEYVDILLAGPGKSELRQLFALAIEDGDEAEAVARARELFTSLPKDANSALMELRDDKDRAIAALARGAIAELGGTSP